MRNAATYGVSLVALTAGVWVGVAANGERVAEAVPPASASAAVQAHADAVYEAFNGSRTERDAGAVLQAYALNGGMDRCMEEAGYPEWDWSAHRAQNPTNHGLETSLFFAAPLAHPITDAVMESAEAARADLAGMQARSGAVESVSVLRCVDQVPAVADSDAANSPAMASTLRESWWRMIRELDLEHGDEEQYSRCLADQDIPGIGSISSADEAIARLTELQPAPDQLPTSPTDTAAKSETWKLLVGAETAWQKVDWQCRSVVYNAHLEGVEAAVRQFENEHAKELEVARAGWVEISEQAGKLGFDGTFAGLGAGQSRS